MSKQTLKDSIAAAIYENTQEEITGEILQEKLFEIIDVCYPELQVIILTASDFEGDTYQNDALVNKQADLDFELFTNGGSGVMLKEGDGYTYDQSYGTITAPAQNYKLKILK